MNVKENDTEGNTATNSVGRVKSLAYRKLAWQLPLHLGKALLQAFAASNQHVHRYLRIIIYMHLYPWIYMQT